MAKGKGRMITHEQEDRILTLVDQGMSVNAIATHTGHSRQTVDRCIAARALARAEVDRFVKDRPDILASLQGKAVRVASKILDSLDREDYQSEKCAISHSEKRQTLVALATCVGIYNDKERLARGLSTQNISQAIMVAQREAELRDAPFAKKVAQGATDVE